ncbi:hypothetical protein Tco_1320060 [Tanacetum coccineum]
MNQNINSFGFDHIQPPQQFDNHQPQETPEVTPFVESKEWIETNNELYKMMEDFTERMNQELHKQKVLLAAQREQKLLVKSCSSRKASSPQNSVFHQLIEEMCGTRASAEQKKNMEDTMLDLLEICRQKSFIDVKNSAEPGKLNIKLEISPVFFKEFQVQRIENKAKTNHALEQLVLVVSLRFHPRGHGFESAEGIIPSCHVSIHVADTWAHVADTWIHVAA